MPISLNTLKSQYEAFFTEYDRVNTPSFSRQPSQSRLSYFWAKTKVVLKSFEMKNDDIHYHGEAGRKRATRLRAVLNDASCTTAELFLKAVATKAYDEAKDSTLVTKIFSWLANTDQCKERRHNIYNNSNHSYAGIPVIKYDTGFYRRVAEKLHVELKPVAPIKTPEPQRCRPSPM